METEPTQPGLNTLCNHSQTSESMKRLLGSTPLTESGRWMDALGLTLGSGVPICAPDVTPTQHPTFPTLCPEAQPKRSIKPARGKIRGYQRPNALLWE